MKKQEAIALTFGVVLPLAVGFVVGRALGAIGQKLIEAENAKEAVADLKNDPLLKIFR